MRDADAASYQVERYLEELLGLVSLLCCWRCTCVPAAGSLNNASRETFAAAPCKYSCF